MPFYSLDNIHHLQKREDAASLVKVSVLVLSLVVTIVLIYFLYNNFYQTISEARAVLVLKQEVALQDIDKDKFGEFLRIHDYKVTNILPTNIPNPFPVPAATVVTPLPSEL